MNRRIALVLGLVAAIALAGCTSPLGQRQQEDEPDVVQIEGPTCTIGGEDCSEATVTKYSSPAEIRMTVSNNGEENMEVNLGRLGSQVLVSRCNADIASLEHGSGGFEARVEGPTRVTTVSGPDLEVPVTVRPDEQLSLSWTLEIVHDDSDVPSLGYTCPLDFELTFDQVLTSAQQIQIKESEDVPDVRELDFTTSSERPVILRIDAPESFVPEGTRVLPVRAYLENRGDGEITDIARIDPGENPGILSGADCPEREFRIYQAGDREGQSYRRLCNVASGDIPLSGSSDIRWARFAAEYSYELPLAGTEISIVPVEGGS